MKVDVSGNRNQPIYSNFGKKRTLEQDHSFPKSKFMVKEKRTKKAKRTTKDKQAKQTFLCYIYMRQNVSIICPSEQHCPVGQIDFGTVILHSI